MREDAGETTLSGGGGRGGDGERSTRGLTSTWLLTITVGGGFVLSDVSDINGGGGGKGEGDRTGWSDGGGGDSSVLGGEMPCDGRGTGCLEKVDGDIVLIKVGERGDTSIGLGRRGKVGDEYRGDETSLTTGDGVDDPDGGGGGGGGGDVPLLSARSEDRNFLSSFGGSAGSATRVSEGLPPDKECRFFKGNGKRSGEFVTNDDIVLWRRFFGSGGFDRSGAMLLSDEDLFDS